MSEMKVDATTETTATKLGPWRKGQSGNPKGRPPGARNKATIAAELLLDGQAKALTQICIDRALGGNPIALRLCLQHILPPRKDRPVRLALPTIGNATDVPSALAVVLKSVSNGELTPDEGVRVAQVIEQLRKAIETTDLEQRIATLEQRVPRQQNETRA